MKLRTANESVGWLNGDGPLDVKPTPLVSDLEMLDEIVSDAMQGVKLTSRRSRYQSKFRLVAAEAYAVGRQSLIPHCDTCAHLRRFDSAKEYFCCQAVNIRVHEHQLSEFGCTLWQPKE